MNPFLLDYRDRLKVWHELRHNLKKKDLNQTCVEVDAFWQNCPISTHYLHPADVEDWPDPWQLLSDNMYCEYARALGMIYTLMLLGIDDVDLVEATDYNSNDVILVLVNCAKYVMNYWPDSVLNSSQSDFRIKRRIDVSSLFKKINIEK
jgi:hypothetical protein